MPKRATVKPNVGAILKMVASNSWSAASFSKMVGKHKRWLSEVKRGNNLPSPEEAARMCVLLQTTPEKILLHEGANEAETAKCQKDIAYVRSLVEKKRAEGIKKERPADGEALSDMQLEAIEFVKSLPEDKLNRFLRLAKAAFEEDGK
jgi:hypothetical protein